MNTTNTMNHAATNTTPRKARNETIRNHGLRQIGERQWLDPETAKACKTMRLEMLASREPTAQELGLFVYLREPMLKDPHFLVAAWEREQPRPVLFERHATIAAALSAMQQVFRRALVNDNATPWSELHGDDEAWRYETRSAAIEGFVGPEFY
ncbi:hypothetical protein THIX_30846 [Thiomonas sp. X19]|uniref:hypothetical protein n=1 Tax=Thiomonas sp. X19 TaxID=1050370 RepID=UPI000B752DA5|nr:hypothetical protein [Thiomonas sp. X19]SCC93618.1 hypothetical protein THIX_30846 [Thiomonas sp. X19]